MIHRLQKNKWFLFLKWTIAIFSLFYIGYHITSRVNNITVENFQSVISKNNFSIPSCIALLLLMIINWTIEAVKWKMLTAQVEKITFLKSVRAVLTGVTLSFYSPNRSGEFLGRVAHLQPQNRFAASLLTFIGSISQLTVTLQAGLIGLVFYFFPNLSSPIIIIHTTLILLISLIVLSNIPRLIDRLKRLKLFSKYVLRFDVVKEFSKTKLLIIYLLSVLRYGVFAFQFYLLLNICKISFPAILMAEKISLSFLLSSLIPSIALGELGVRGSVNLNLFSANHIHDTEVLVASFLLWLINLAIPALMGALSSFYIRWNNTTK